MKKAFTLIELLVVISIIAVLAVIVIASLNNAKVKAKDLKTKQDLKQLQNAMELYYSDHNEYMASLGLLSEYGRDSFVDIPELTPEYISQAPNNTSFSYQYWRKDYRTGEYPCMTLNNIDKFAFYGYLENPSATDLNTIKNGDSFDRCVNLTWGLNYKVGN